MSRKYFLKFKNVSIGVFEENGNALKFEPSWGADTLPRLLGYPMGLYKVDRTSTPWMPDRNKVADNESIMSWLSERVFSKDRPDASVLLNNLGVSKYAPWEIVKRTSGLTFHDHFWITPDDEVTYEVAKESRKVVGIGR
jgi:hypothetical protein